MSESEAKASPVTPEIQWTPGIGDPTVVGWLTVVAYFAAAWLGLRSLMVEKSGPPRPYRTTIAALGRVIRRRWPDPPAPARRAALWLVLASILTLLGINKQLDLQSLLTEIGRVMAYHQGWYRTRRAVQVVFILMVLMGGLVGLRALFWLARGHLTDFRLALGGMIFLLAFVMIRASSFHHMDQLMGMDLVGIKINWLFELSGIGMVGAAAGRRLRQAEVPLWRGWSRPSGSVERPLRSEPERCVGQRRWITRSGRA